MINYIEMIRLFKNKKLVQEYPKMNIANMRDVEKIFKALLKLGVLEDVKVNPSCEEPMQEIMRQNGFTIQSF